MNADSEQTRRRILAAAMTHVAEVGYMRATMKSIAVQAGITSAAIYRYFPSKSRLIMTALDTVADEVLGRMERAAFAEDTLARRLVALLEEALAATKDYPAMTLFEAAVLGELACNPEFAAVVTKRRRVEENLYRRLFADAVRTGELRADVPVQALVDMFTSITWGLGHLSATVSPDRYQAALRMTEALVEGTVLPAAPRPL